MYINNSIKIACKFAVIIMDRLQKLGRDLGYEGKDLQDFVAQENKRERDERASEREIEKRK